MSRLFFPIKTTAELIPNLEDLSVIEIEPKFGRTPFYMLFDAEEGSTELIRNQNHHFGGDIPPFTLAKKLDVDVVLASHLGSKPYKGFTEKNISIYQTLPNQSVKGAISQFIENNLEVMKIPEEGTCCSGAKHSH